MCGERVGMRVGWGEEAAGRDCLDAVTGVSIPLRKTNDPDGAPAELDIQEESESEPGAEVKESPDESLRGPWTEEGGGRGDGGARG